MTDKDPLTGGYSSPPAAAVTPGATDAARSRHAVAERLAGHGEKPLTPEAGPSAPALAARIAHLDSRLQLHVTFLWAGIVFVLAITLLTAYLDHRSRARVDDLSARQVAASVEQSRINGETRNAICQAVLAWRATYSAPGRDAFPGGSGPYNALFAQLAQASGTLNCDAG